MCMNRIVIIPIIMLLVAFGCSSQENRVVLADKVVTSGDDPGPPGSIHNLPKGCFVMKKIASEEYDCFGCVGDVCIDEDLNVWDYTGQDLAKNKGFFCLETADGCILG